MGVGIAVITVTASHADRVVRRINQRGIVSGQKTDRDKGHISRLGVGDGQVGAKTQGERAKSGPARVSWKERLVEAFRDFVMVGL